jgi:GNAT superfamily N-acetyltransferase
LAGIATYLRHFYERNQWYMGLMILDPSERGQNLGRRTAEHVFAQARSEGGTLIRIAVLDANPRGRKFWEGLGFKFERTVPADQNDDGQERHVLQKTL